MRRLFYAFGLCGLMLLTACNSKSPKPASLPASTAFTGGVAVIDLDEVARLLGREALIKQTLAERENTFNQQLELMRVSYTNQVNERKQELTEQPEAGPASQVQALEQQAVARIQQARQQAQNELNTQKHNLITAFREEIKPVATQVAMERGLSIVVSKNESFLFAFDKGVDITQDVVNQMRVVSPANPVSTSQTAPVAPDSGTSLSPSPRLPAAEAKATAREPGLLPPAPERPLRGE